MASCFEALDQLTPKTLGELKAHILAGEFNPIEAVGRFKQQGVDIKEIIFRIYALDILKRPQRLITNPQRKLYEKRLNDTKGLSIERIKAELDEIKTVFDSLSYQEKGQPPDKAWLFKPLLDDRKTRLENALEQLLELEKLRIDLFNSKRIHSFTPGLPAYIQSLRDEGYPVTGGNGCYFFEEGWQQGDYSKASKISKIRRDLVNGLSIDADHARAYGVVNLSSVISQLKEAGWPIAINKPTKGKATYSVPVGWQPCKPDQTIRQKKAR